MDIFSIALGAGGVGLAWFIKLAGGKALPAALAWFRAKWSTGKPGLSSLQDDVAAAHRKIDTVRSGVSASFAGVYAEIDEIKAKLGLPISTGDPTAPGKAVPASLQEQS